MMKLIIGFFSGVYFLSCISTCSSGLSANSIIGEWEIKEASGFLADMNLGTTYEFGENSKIIIQKGGFSNEGIYSISGDTIRSLFGTISIVALFKIEGSRMHYKILNSNQEFELKKL